MTPPTTVKEVLVQARDLISDPKRWTHLYAARNAVGDSVGPCAEDAVCWCSVGAVEKVGSNLYFDVTKALRKVMGDSIPKFNDSSPHEDVLAAFDIAICLES